MAFKETERRGALAAYQAMAPIYDEFTAHFETDAWISDLLKVLGQYDLNGKRLLDVACGTGESFIPMLRRGWTVRACDISPAMLARATAKAGDDAEASIADMRALPIFGAFDLVWALDDAVNYLLSQDELESALRGMRSNLSGKGLLLFDANELLVYRTYYAETSVIERGGRRFVWRGLRSAEVEPGSLSESRLEVVGPRRGSSTGQPPCVSIHRQRHFPESAIRRALTNAGLKCLTVLGQGLDGIPCHALDPSIHTKAIYVARRA